MPNTCDLCGRAGRALTCAADLWGLGPVACCVDAVACAGVWAAAFAADTATLQLATEVLPFRLRLDDLDGPTPRIETHRLTR